MVAERGWKSPPVPGNVSGPLQIGTGRHLLYMACLLLILVVAFPRIVLLILFFASHYLERAYHGLLIPVIGFIFLPLTTLAYAWMVNSGLPAAGVNLIILLIALVIDIGGLGGSEYRRRRW